jgi:hypothetical protein
MCVRACVCVCVCTSWRRSIQCLCPFVIPIGQPAAVRQIRPGLYIVHRAARFAVSPVASHRRVERAFVRLVAVQSLVSSRRRRNDVLRLFRRRDYRRVCRTISLMCRTLQYRQVPTVAVSPPPRRRSRRHAKRSDRRALPPFTLATPRHSFFSPSISPPLAAAVAAASVVVGRRCACHRVSVGAAVSSLCPVPSASLDDTFADSPRNPSIGRASNRSAHWLSVGRFSTTVSPASIATTTTYISRSDPSPDAHPRWRAHGGGGPQQQQQQQQCLPFFVPVWF